MITEDEVKLFIESNSKEVVLEMLDFLEKANKEMGKLLKLLRNVGK